MAAPVLGLRFAGLRDALPAALGFNAGGRDACGRTEFGLGDGCVLDVAFVLAVGVAGSASVGAARFRSPRVCPVR